MLLERQLTRDIIGAAIEVHRELGPGLLESAYQACMERELALKQIPFEPQKSLPVTYKGARLECGYRLDLVVSGRIVVEMKAVDEILAVHKAQLLTYLRLTGCRIGLLINFNVSVLTAGLRRLVL